MGERDHFREREEIRFILLVHRKRGRRFSTENEEEGSAQKMRQQAVLYGLYSSKSTGRTSAFNAGSRTAAQKSIFVLAD